MEDLITVKATSSEERDNEIKELFEEMKPYLDEGLSYHRALNKVKKTKVSYAQRMWYRDLVKYGESQGYDYKTYSNIYEHKYGLYNVQLMKHKSSLTGYYWIYRYVNDDGESKSISDMDLGSLRKKVESRNLVWKVIDIGKAKESYDLNMELMENKRDKRVRTSSGVKYVSKSKSKNVKRGFYWSYTKNMHISSMTLLKLKERVEEQGLKWDIIDNEIYENNLLSDEEYLSAKQGGTY